MPYYLIGPHALSFRKALRGEVSHVSGGEEKFPKCPYLLDGYLPLESGEV